MAYTPNPTWKDWPDTSTQFTAATANNIEAGILDASARLDVREAQDVTTAGESTFPRLTTMGTATVPLTGQVWFSYFTAAKTETINTVKVWSGTTAAGATPTLLRFGLYSVDGVGDLTLVASTTSDTTLLAATNTAYTKALSAPWSKVRGTRYAFAYLIVTSFAAPALAATLQTASVVLASILSEPPRMFGYITGASDLPSTVTEVSIAANTAQNRLLYARMY